MSENMPVQSPTRSQEAALLGPRELVYMGFRRRWLVLAVWLPILVVGFLALYRQAGSFIASSKVMLELSAPSNPNSQHAVRSGDYDLALSTYSNLGMSVPVANLAADVLIDSLEVLAMRDPLYVELNERDKMLGFILDHLSIGRVEESNLLDIQYASPYWDVSLMVNRAVRDAFLDYTARAGTNKGAMVYYDEQMADIQGSIDSLLADREMVAMESGLSDLVVDSRNNANLSSGLEADLFRLEADISFRQSQIGHLRTAVANNPDYMPLDVSSVNMAGGRGRLDDEERELSRMLSLHPADSPPVRRQQEIVDKMRETLQGMVQDYITSQEIELAAKRTQANILQAQLNEVQTAREAIPNAYRQITLIDAQVRAKTRVLEEVQMKHGEVMLNAMADERVNRLIKVTEPEIVTVISSARRFMYMGMLAIFGLVMGIMVALIVDRSDHRIHNTTALAEVVDAPVLGAVSVHRD